MSHMGTKAKQATIESKALSVAIKRAMLLRGLKTPALAKESGVPYGTLRRILELNTVADIEQLAKIANALHVMLSDLVKDSENLTADPEFIADYERSQRASADTNYLATDNVSDSVPLTADGEVDYTELTRRFNPEELGMAAYRDHNKYIESQTPTE